MSNVRERLIVALDVPHARRAQELVTALGDSASFFKVGLQLYAAEGPRVVRDLVESGRKVFLDLKFHDIPNTVAEAVKVAAGLGAAMISVHAAGGQRMLQAAAQAAASCPARPMVVAVTVLTSLEDGDMQKLGISGRTLDQVVRLARVAQTAGCGGVVASARETRELRARLGSELTIVVPGVRPAGAAHDDQARVESPREAIAAGATHIVVGRPVTGARDPRAAAQAILREISPPS